MIESRSFATRARTVDHLGREQIADVPTAISELWKNAFDAYATHVNLSVYDGKVPVVAISDDGHGMSYQEFAERWLVVGTETKLFGGVAPEEDRFGLGLRPKQGQKGIGRLSSAHLGPLMLVVSKRQKHDYVVALIDWRIFENPYLLLSDIKIPVARVTSKDQVLSLLPDLFERLTENIWGSSRDPDRSTRIIKAWELYDLSAEEEWKELQISMNFSEEGQWRVPSERIAKTIISTRFEPRHLDAWPVWHDEVDHGTAMLISDVNPDFLVFLPETRLVGTEEFVKKRFFQTLSSFVDPYCEKANEIAATELCSREVNGRAPKFQYSFDVVLGPNREKYLGHELPFDRRSISEMEHVLFGTVDENGDFSGCVKSFGKWRKINYEYKIKKPTELKLPSRTDSKIGPFDIFVSTYEQVYLNSSHEREQWQYFENAYDPYASFMVFRDGLRVLPYGREDSDFFEIETRRSKHAGREFWNARRMFGRVALSRHHNPNLKDKAGREGFIDNTTAKALKQLGINILMQSARDYFGTGSEPRANDLGDIKDRKAEEKARIEAERVRKQQKREYISNIDKALTKLPMLVKSLEDQLKAFQAHSIEDISPARKNVSAIRERLDELRVRGVAPLKISAKNERNILTYKDTVATVRMLIDQVSTKLDEETERLAPKDPAAIFEEQLKLNQGQITRRVNSRIKRISSLLTDESNRIEMLRNEQIQKFRDVADGLIPLVRERIEPLSSALKRIETARQDCIEESEELFEGYIAALETLSENINLQNIALYGAYENENLKAEVERLNELAQLGIAVEILGHELQSYDNMIGSGLADLPKDMQNSRPVHSIRSGYEGLTRQLHFLTPLKVSGYRSMQMIKGDQIYAYVSEFFGDLLSKRGITFETSEMFRKMRIYEQPARIYPVFINLVNNSQYWLHTSEQDERKIILDVIDEKVVVSDNGPGVDGIDIKRLFTLFFTRRSQGGRGIGLYLCRANLRSGGHSIEYLDKTDALPLQGANFAIKFSNLEIAD